jgi:RNA polymerase sigma-70 factor (ECF subfamily)
LGAVSDSAPESRLLDAALAGDEQAFERLTGALRREIYLHCYRMLGSLDDADDAVQETLVRAWRALARFEPRAPLRAWLYRIATNVCLSALERRARRREEPRLDPFPDRLLDEVAPGPDAYAVERESVQLAFVAAVQVLPPRQRVVLLLRDVLDWSAREVADLLETSVASVNSALQRARAGLEREREAGLLTKAHSPPESEVERRLVRRFVEAWQATDVDGLVALLAEDALLTMPPLPLRVAGSDAIGEFLSTRPAGGQLHRFRLVETRANRQPAVALYLDGEAHAVMTMALDGGEIAALTRFGEPRLFPRFGLPISYAMPAGSMSGTPIEERS